MKPIIDVHEHIFNARDIPLKGYLLSRKLRGIKKLLGPIIIPAAAKRIRRKLRPKKKEGFFSAIWGYVALFVAYVFQGKKYRLWGDTLSKTVECITCELIESFQGDEIDLYVPLMLDYEYWFKNTPDNLIKNQIDHIYENIVIPFEGMIHPFVPFDPARELAFRKKRCNPDGYLEKHSSLALVKDAIENKGFIGVKLYNAMGYRPFNNALVDVKRRKIALHKEKYVFKGEEYDKVLSELYDYCIENDVPVTTHCGMEGSESYYDASFDFGQAKLWRDVLDQAQWAKLRLNLAHFGWNKKSFHEGDRSWTKEICEMLGKFNNLYTDVSHHEVVLKKNVSRFKKAYEELCHDYPHIKQKLLFGIDWHVIKRLKNFKNFKDSYVAILKHNDLFTQNEIDDFLGGNAMKFLGLMPGEKNQERLDKFYKKHNIRPPAWFSAIKPGFKSR